MFEQDIVGDKFLPMIEVTVNGQVERTKIVQPPLNFAPVWKEVLPFDIMSPRDQVEIKIMNMSAPINERVLVPRVFTVGADMYDEVDEDIADLKQ